MKTWGDIKNETLQLMFSYSNLGELDLSDANKDYLLAMPAAANYALIELASIRPIIKMVRVNQHPAVNMLGTEPSEVTQDGGSISYEVTNPGSYVFELSGVVDVDVIQDGSVIARYENIEQRGFTVYRNNVPGEGHLVLTFSGDTLFTIRNLAIYAETFSSVDLIPLYSPQQAYNIRELGEGYMRIAPEKPVWYHGRDISPYTVRNRDTVFIDRTVDGEIQIYYDAYPDKLTEETPDDFLIRMEDEALELLPLYMASRLYMDDDSSIATLYYNMYDAKKQELINMNEFSAPNDFVSESGWI